MIKKWKVTIPKLTGETPRQAYIYLPASYEKNPEQRYPVLYMFDGHNVFFDKDATYGKCWGMKEYMQLSKKQLIIVAVECNHEGNKRLIEYSPMHYENPFMGKVRGKGQTYMNWLVDTLKPYVDANFRTLPERENTVIAGSSMGGLMSLYAVTAYNHVFGKAACLSPSVWVDPGKVLDMVGKSHIRPGTNIYMNYGEVEMANHFAISETLVAVNHLLIGKHANTTFRIVPGGEHNEATWEKEIPVFMECLGL